MKIKTKLRLGFGFLFLVVLLFGAISLYYMNKISISSKVILKDNYKSLRLTSSMRAILEDHTLPLSPNTKREFSALLEQERRNITESGERKAVELVRHAFEELSDPAVSLKDQARAMKSARQQLRIIDQLNMAAISSKNDAALHGVEQAAAYLIFAASICFLVLFSFMLNFPGFVANPLREFSEAIKGISRQNYKQQLQFNSTDEFAELAKEFNTMARHLNKWENSNLAKLQSEKLRIEAIIEQMNDAIIGLDEQKKILFINKVACSLLNMDKTDVMGQGVNALVDKNDLLKKILNAEAGGKNLTIYADHKTSYFQLEQSIIQVPAFAAEDETLTQANIAVGEVYVLRNITPFKELDEAKTNFIATVSHELKTPISAIKMSVSILEDERVGVMNAEQKEMVQHIADDCGRLLKITSELLDLAQVETGNLQLSFRKTDPATIVNYAVDALRFQAEQREIQLELHTAPNLPLLNVDVEKTAWVLINFLTNALRYSANRSKVVLAIENIGNGVAFSVKDFGQGIPEQYQERLFERYFQVPTDGKNKSGSGLGLAISKDFIEAQGGTIWVESALGEGSRFCFKLPGLTES
jgi:signal transduction histidine kinase/HAMP domain-containing protein